MKQININKLAPLKKQDIIHISNMAIKAWNLTWCHYGKWLITTSRSATPWASCFFFGVFFFLLLFVVPVFTSFSKKQNKKIYMDSCQKWKAKSIYKVAVPAVICFSRRCPTISQVLHGCPAVPVVTFLGNQSIQKLIYNDSNGSMLTVYVWWWWGEVGKRGGVLFTDKAQELIWQQCHLKIHGFKTLVLCM